MELARDDWQNCKIKNGENREEQLESASFTAECTGLVVRRFSSDDFLEDTR
jgi:hypothetical protein